jgi:predicted Zn-dependent protease
MSLINDALRSLEKKSNDTGRKKDMPSYAFANSNNDNHGMKMFFLIMGITAVVTTSSVFLWVHHAHHRTVLKPQTQPQPQPQMPVAVPVAHTLPPTPTLKPATMIAPKIIANTHPIATPEKIHITAVKDSEKSLSTLYNNALANVKSNNVSQAITQLEKVIAMEPSFNQARQLLIVLLMQQKNMTKANVYLDEGLKLAPQYLAFVTLKAHVFIDKKQYQQAQTLMEEYSPSFAENPDFYALKASVDELDANYDDAITLYTKLSAAYPMNASFLVGLGVAYQSKGDNEEASNMFQKALEMGRLDPSMQDYIKQQLSSE